MLTPFLEERGVYGEGDKKIFPAICTADADCIYDRLYCSVSLRNLFILLVNLPRSWTGSGLALAITSKSFS